jgi:hypothetical protein
MLGHPPLLQLPGGFPNSALSKIRLMRSGFATPRPYVTTIIADTIATFPRYGRNESTTRRTVPFLIGR